MNDKKNISIYLPASFVLEIDDFIENNNIPSRGEFFFAAAQYYIKNSNRTRLENDNDSDIKPIEEPPADSSNQNLIEVIESSNRNLIEKLDILIEHTQSQNTSTRVPDESGIDILSKINNNLEELLAAFIDDKSSKTSETIIDDNQPSSIQSSINNSPSKTATKVESEVDEDGIDKNTLAYLKSLHGPMTYDWPDD